MTASTIFDLTAAMMVDGPRKRAARARNLRGALLLGSAMLPGALATPALASPDGAQVVAGSATVAGEGSGHIVVTQQSDRAIIDWRSFSLKAGESARFNQPGTTSITLNRVFGGEASSILGSLTANGRVFLINPNGVLFGAGSRVDVGGLVVSTADIANDAFMAGGALRFDKPGKDGASIVNQGRISVRDSGVAAFVAPNVRNEGIVTARGGRVAFGGAETFTLDLAGDNLIRFQVGDEVKATQGDGTGALVDVGGVVDVRGGTIQLTARAARDVVNASVRISAFQPATGVTTNGDGSFSLTGGATHHNAGTDTVVGAGGALALDGRSAGGDAADPGTLTAAFTGTAAVDGAKLTARAITIDASGTVEMGKGALLDLSGAANGGTAGGKLAIDADSVVLDGNIDLEGSARGGSAQIRGTNWVSFGSALSASGATAGGSVDIASGGGLSLAGTIAVNAPRGRAGSVKINAVGRAIDTGDAFVDATGLHGGSISYISASQIISSGAFRASGTMGFGGQIDVTAPRLDLFSSQFYAQGGVRGGRVRIGGEFQGGKGLTTDELANARRLVATDAVTIDVSSLAQRGTGGDIVVWSDEKTTFLGTVKSMGGTVAGNGGLIEVSGAEDLLWRGTVETARGGMRGGTLLLDPKNITIADATTGPSQLNLVLDAFSNALPSPGVSQLTTGDQFGESVSLDGLRLAIGSRNDSGAFNTTLGAGAVYLFTFSNLNFATPVLQSIIGSGYTGGKNLALGQLEANDAFGASVSLDGNRLAVGAFADHGFGNVASASGAVYLFSFADANFTTPTLQAIIGNGYVGGKNLAVTGLEIGDRFGISVSLNGNRLAVGATGDDGAANNATEAGAVYLFTFADGLFSTPVQQGVLGFGYTGGKNLSPTGLTGSMLFGAGVSLDGNRLAVGAPSVSEGRVYLFSFDDAAFGQPTLEARIGLGFTGGKNLSIASLDAADSFGASVSLKGNRLAVGATGDDGDVNLRTDTGAVHLFSFADSSFAAPTLVATVGANYVGGKNVRVSDLDPNDAFGRSVSLDGNRLAVGASGDDGPVNATAFSNAGAVYLFSFTDANYDGGRLETLIGGGYTGGRNLSVEKSALAQNSTLGQAVSLDGLRLAIGVSGDAGASKTSANTGAVYLFTFGDRNFTSPTLQSIIGLGYSGGKNLSVANLGANDAFGSAVSLNGNRLAVGAPRDDGATNASTDVGAVYLFNFADANFTAPSLTATLGSGYSGGKNLTVAGLGGGDEFGTSVSLDGLRLAVGAQGDDGPTNTSNNTGAVYLFSFADLAFTTPTLQSTIGAGYSGGKNLSVAALGFFEFFGRSVSLDGNRLAVGSIGDDGATNLTPGAGAVYLFTFTDAAFSGGALTATIGRGYSGGKNFSLPDLASNDQFGTSVSLDGNALAVGAFGDNGLFNTTTGAGAVYLFSFSDAAFSTPTLTSRIGKDYSAAGSHNVLNLAANDHFGSAVSLDGDRLAVGARFDDGSSNQMSDSGAVYLFSIVNPATPTVTLLTTIGQGYGITPTVPGLKANDGFAASIALDGNRLVVGVPGDDGVTGNTADAGAVYLFTFADAAFATPVLQGIIGVGYSGGKNLSVVSLEAGDQFGTGVSINGNRLAVGANGDDGRFNDFSETGAAYLFTFTDANFGGGALAAILGVGYTGGKNRDVIGLSSLDNFGVSVSLDGNRLAVGAPGDDGQGNLVTDSGAVYLFSFTDSAFSGGAEAGRLGAGYVLGTNYLNVPGLQASDEFGRSVSLDGNRLAVGAIGDDGALNSQSDAGAVYLFTFANASFATPTLAGIYGTSYSGGKNLDLANVQTGDRFGTSVSLDGLRLAIGAPRDDGSGNAATDSGAVYLVTFADDLFTTPALQATFGAGYGAMGGKNRTVAEIAANDLFGFSVSIDAERLAVGALFDDGATNSTTDAGAVYLFTFGDTLFTQSTLRGTLGAGYRAYTPVNLASSPTIISNEFFGTSVSLSGNRLAVGASGDSGALGNASGAGAVYLFTFANAAFSTPTLQSIIGFGYSGGKNLSVGTLAATDVFATSVSLDGNRLAVGAPSDDGATNSVNNSGAVYLFSFADASFTAPTLEARIGVGYTGGKNLSMPDLAISDSFGWSVSLDGNRLAVGAPGDDGFGESSAGSGAVYLFTFADATFATPALAGTIGKNYVGASSHNVANLDANDQFGYSVSLDGDRLAVGARADRSAANNLSQVGAVYLFSFADAVFATPTVQAIVGKGYTGGKNIDVADLEANDQFGISVSLDGNRLAVGAPNDGGFQNSVLASGSVYLFTFADAQFSGGSEVARFGAGWLGTNDLSLTQLGSGDSFGRSVSLDAGRLAVGANNDDGQGNSVNNSGAVYLFTLGGSSSTAFTYGASPGDSVTITPTAIANILNTGTGLVLQANNDITVTNAITVNNPAGNGGALTLQAGRSVLINAGITTDNGNITVIANDLIANGVIDAHRDAGAAEILFGTGGFINAGTGAVSLHLRSGAGKTNFASGNINLRNITGGTISAVNDGPTAGSGIVINSGAVLTASGAGNAIILSGKRFTNNGGAGALALTGGGRFLIYSDNWDNDTRGGLVGGNLYNRTFAGHAPGTITQTGNQFLFSRQPILTVTPQTAATREYGAVNPAFTATITGLVNGDSAAAAYAGAPSVTTPAGQFANAGTYAINAALGSLVSDIGYGFAFGTPGTLTVTKALLTVTADNKTREYGAVNPTLTGTITGFKGTDTAAVVTGLTYGTTAGQFSNVGAYAINGSGGVATNYDFAYVPGTLTVTKALLTVTADNKTREYGAVNPALTGTITGFKGTDTAAVVTGLTYGTTAGQFSNVGAYAINGVGGTATNYDFAYVPGTLTVTKALLTVTADNKTREYGAVNPTLTGTITGFKGTDTAAVVTGLTYGTTAGQFSNVGAYAINGVGGTATNYDFAYVPGTLTVTKALLTVTADNKTREYGAVNPALTGTITGFKGTDTAAVVTGLTYGTTAGQFSNVGAYAINGSGGTATNYDFAYVPGTLTVTKALLTVTADNKTRTYGAANPALTGTITGFKGTDTDAVVTGLSYATVATQASNVGAYAINASGGVATNYDFTYVPGTLTVTKALLTVTADNKTRTYGAANPTLTGTISGLVNGDAASVVSGLTYATSATQGSNVGTYAINASGGTATNYDFAYVPGTLTVTKALLTVTADNKTRTYGAANPALTGTISGLVNGDAASVVSGLTYATSATQGSNVGTYAINASGGTATNYDFAYVPGTLTVTKALLTVTADNKTRTYGAANPALTGTISGLVNGDAASVVSGLTYATSATQGSNVGTYAINGSGGTATNYDFAYVPGTLTVTKALLTVTADNKTRTYGAANPALTGTISGLVNGDAASVVSGLTYATSATQGSNVDTYAINASGGTATNYDFAYVPGTLTVTKALLTVTADNKTRTYGAANPALTGTISGLVNGDAATVVSGLTYATSATQGSNVGAYAINASGGVATNYDFTYVPGTLTVTKALLTVTADNKTRTYGAANPALTGTISGLVNGDAASVVSGLTYATSATQASNVGAYAINASGGTATNYDFAYVPGTLTVTKALLTVTADNKTRTYGAANPALTGTISGLVNGDAASVVSGLTYATSATQASNVGAYAINASGGTATNYDFAYVPGTLTVTKALLTVTADNKTRTYGAANPALTGTISGLVNGDAASVVSGLTYATSATQGSNVGTYAINASGGVATNYDFAYVPGTLTVTKALLTVTADNKTRTYGAANPALTGTISGLVNGDAASVVSGLTYATSATQGSNAGTYAINGSGGVATNYDFTYVPGTLTVTKALLTVTADNKTRTYGTANPALTGTISGLVNGDAASVVSGLTYATSATQGSNVGTYAINGSGGTATNYDFAYVPGTLTVTKALLTVTADNKTRTYGAANPALTGTISGLVNGDAASVVSGLTYATSATQGSNAGTYAINGSGGVATNYDFAYVPGTLTVTKALLTVTADNKTRTYGAANPALTGTISGLVNGDAASVVSGLTYATSATQGSNVGTYAINASGGVATNYNFAYVPGTLTLTKALLTVTADNKSKLFGVANPALTGRISGLVNGDTANVVAGLVYNTAASTFSPVGTYAINAGGATATNYNFAYVPGVLTISAAVQQTPQNTGLAAPVIEEDGEIGYIGGQGETGGAGGSTGSASNQTEESEADGNGSTVVKVGGDIAYVGRDTRR